MKQFLPLFALPALALAGQISGTVSDLSGAPLPGVVVAGSTESDVSKPSGSWILGRVSGNGAKSGAQTKVSTNLVIQDGHARLAWKGHGLDGRTSGSSNRGASNPVAARTARSAVPETLWVYWKGKRLVQLPLSTDDTTGVSIRIDTAWNDDFGIPWNPKVEYGTMRDERDGKVYRTVKIGDWTWTAENLAYRGPSRTADTSGRCMLQNEENCGKFGRYYTWAEAYDVDPDLSQIGIPYSETQKRGICPQGWFLPRESEWIALSSVVDPSNTQIRDYATSRYGLQTGVTLLFLSLRATGGWAGGDTEDPFGFRALTTGFGGWGPYDDPQWIQDTSASFWMSNNLRAIGPGSPDPLGAFELGPKYASVYSQASGGLYSIRCVQAAPVD